MREGLIAGTDGFLHLTMPQVSGQPMNGLPLSGAHPHVQPGHVNLNSGQPGAEPQPILS